MKRLLLALFAMIVSSAAAEVSENDLRAAEAAMGSNLGRYMQEGDRMVAPCSDASPPLADWATFPVRRCEYRASTPDKPVLVAYLLNADRKQLAKWIVSGCRAAGSPKDKKCYEWLASHIKAQSGYQFAVAGLVDESDAKGVCHSKRCFFTFRDGVAVNLPALASSKASDGPNERALQHFNIKTQESQVREGSFNSPGARARIASTEVSHLVAWLRRNPADLPTDGRLSAQADAWLKRQLRNGGEDNWDTEVLRHFYKQAWASERYVLIDAWAWANRRCILVACKE